MKISFKCCVLVSVYLITLCDMALAIKDKSQWLRYANEKPQLLKYFDTQVTDEFHWMEKGENGIAQQWMLEQADRTNAMFGINKKRREIFARLEAIQKNETKIRSFQKVAGREFYLFRGESSESMSLMTKSASGQEKVLVDIEAFSKAQGKKLNISRYAASWDGKKVAVHMAAPGERESKIHFIEVDSGNWLADKIDDAHSFRFSWMPNNQALIYTRQATENKNDKANMQVYLHQLNTSQKQDRAIFGAGLGGIPIKAQELPFVLVQDQSPWTMGIILTVGREIRVYAIKTSDLAQGGKLKWRELASYNDGVGPGSLTFIDNSFLYSSKKNAPNGQIWIQDILSKSRKVLVKEREGTMRSFAALGNNIYFVVNRDGYSNIFKQPLQGGVSKTIALPHMGAI